MLAVIEWTHIALMLSVAGIAWLAVALRSVQRRLGRIERTVDIALNAAGFDPDELPRRELSRQTRTLADVGERQLAIELHQREFGLSFDDAQVAVEAYMRGESGTVAAVPLRRPA